MIAYIQGRVVERGIDSIVLDHQGIGYRIFLSESSQFKLDQDYRIYTYQHVREDLIQLFGFKTKLDRKVFLEIINVKGIGPKTAMNILSKTNAQTFVEAINREDLSFLTSLPGVGKKTGSQMLLDLKGKFGDIHIKSIKQSDTKVIEEALTALKDLGFKNSEVQSIKNVLSLEENQELGHLIKTGLKLLHRGGQ